MISSYAILEMAKDRQKPHQWLPGWRWGKGSSTKGQRVRELLYTLLIVVMIEHIYKSSQNSTPKGTKFTTCKTYTILNKRKRRVRNPGYKQVRMKITQDPITS